jgi:hypothetical protein
VHLPNFDFNDILSLFGPLILVIMSVLIHIQDQRISGVFNKVPYDFESFESGIRRYTLLKVSKS